MTHTTHEAAAQMAKAQAFDIIAAQDSHRRALTSQIHALQAVLKQASEAAGCQPDDLLTWIRDKAKTQEPA